MIQIKHIANTNIYEFEVDKSMDVYDLENLLDFITLKGKKNQKIKMLSNIKSIAAFNNVRNDAEKLVSKYEPVEAISVYVLLSDLEWLEDLLPIGDFFTNDLKIKQFKISEREKAITWLNEN